MTRSVFLFPFLFLTAALLGCTPEVIVIEVPEPPAMVTQIDSIEVREPVQVNESDFPFGISAGEIPLLTYCSWEEPMPLNVLLTEDAPAAVTLTEWEATTLTFPAADGGHVLLTVDAMDSSQTGRLHRITPEGNLLLPQPFDAPALGGRSQFGKELFALSYGLTENGLPAWSQLTVAELGEDGAIANERLLVDIDDVAFFGNLEGKIPFALNAYGEIALGVQKQTHVLDENGYVTAFCTAPTVFFRKADGTVIEHNLLGEGGCDQGVSVFGIERLASDEHFSVLWGSYSSQRITEIDHEGNLVDIGEFPVRAVSLTAVGDSYLIAYTQAAPQPGQVAKTGIALSALSRDLSTATAMGQTAVYDGDISSFPVLDVDAKGENAFLTYIRTTVVNFQTLEEKNTTETVSAKLTVTAVPIPD